MCYPAQLNLHTRFIVCRYGPQQRDGKCIKSVKHSGVISFGADSSPQPKWTNKLLLLSGLHIFSQPSYLVKKTNQLYFVGFHMIKKNLHKFKGSAVFILIAGFTGSAAKKLCK